MSRCHYNETLSIVTEVTNQNKHLMQVMEEACRMVPKLAIREEELVKVCICKLAIWVRDAHT